jgi:hypothetical protein
MRATWRQLAVWPYPPAPKSSVTFRADWSQTIRNLGEEIERIKGSAVLIGIVADDSQFLLDGSVKPGFKTTHPGVEVSFDTPDRGRLAFHTDAFGTVQANLRAISNGLEALRAVDRYGITSGNEQYAGFAQLSPGGPDPLRGKRLVDEAGSLAKALKTHHPDQGGSAAAFADVQAYRKSIGAAAR